MTIRDLFENEIIYADEDFIIKEHGNILVDNREDIDKNIENFLDKEVHRIKPTYSSHYMFPYISIFIK